MCIASMKTMTAALRGQRLLLGAGIESQIVSLDRTLTKNGCAYGLSYPCTRDREVERILNAHKVAYGQLMGRREG